MKNSRKRFTVIANILILVSVSLPAVPGRLDQNFGSNGIVLTTLPSVVDHTRRILVQPDGKILVLTTHSMSAIRTPTAASIRRFMPDGAYDMSFATTGQLSLGGLRDFAVLQDGRILTVQTGYGNPAFGLVCRWTFNGAPDGSFGNGGCRAILTADRFEARRIKVQADGKIVIVAAANAGSMKIARLLSDGVLDGSFGNSGVTTVNGSDPDYYIVGPWVIDKTGPLEIQPDGKILYGYGQDWDSSVYFGRLNQDGSIDDAFGNQGQVSVGIPTTSYSYDGFSFSIALLADGKIYATGTATDWYGRDSFVSVARLKNDGSFDSTFGTNGVASFHSSESRGPASALVLLPNNKILLGGMDDQAFSLLRLNEDGTIDTRFGNGGIVQTQVGTSDLTSILAMQLQADGSLIAAGSFSGANYSANIGLVKYRDVAASAFPAKFDFNGDGRTDVSIFRPNPTSLLDNGAPEGSFSQWWIGKSSTGSLNYAVTFGVLTDTPVPADYTGDGKADVAFFRPSTGEWYVLRSEDFSFFAFPFGAQGDIPAPGDYDGDGKADPAVFRPSAGTWFILRSSDSGISAVPFGVSEDKPIVADYDGDGMDDVAVYRPSANEWWLLRSTAGVLVLQFGAAGDRSAIGDWTGDGKADVAFFRPSTSEFFVLRSEDRSFFAFPWGIPGDVPAPGDYDGDGVTDAAVYRPAIGTWFINGSTSGFLSVPFGLSGDTPVPSSTSVQ